MEKKITKKDFIAKLAEIVEGVEVENKQEILDFLAKEKALVEKKRSTQTKTQKENEKLIEEIYGVMLDMEPATSTEIFGKAKDIENVTSPQKVSAMLKKLVAAGRVERIQEGKKVLFKVVD